MKSLKGPILVLGAGGFIGSNIFRALQIRDDVFGTITKKTWRLDMRDKLIYCDLLKDVEILLGRVRPGTIINCAAYGSFPDEQQISRIYATNLDLVRRILYKMGKDCIYVHAGTSSEYGFNSAGPKETARLTPNSDYAISKAAASQLIEYAGKQLRYKCASLRLYSVYGPYESPTRLMPKLVAAAHMKQLPLLVHPHISRDFVYVDDVVEAFITVARDLQYDDSMRGESYNIGTGICTHIAELVKLTKCLFEIEAEPDYSMAARKWDAVGDWFADPGKASDFWVASTSLQEGLLKMYEIIK